MPQIVVLHQKVKKSTENKEGENIGDQINLPSFLLPNLPKARPLDNWVKE